MISRRQQQDLLKDVHSAEGGGGHLGMNKTMKKLTERFFWETMTEDTRNFIRTCRRCQQVNTSYLNKGKQELHNIPVPSRIFSQVGIDIMHMPEVDGYKYLITAIDYLSKYVEMRPLKQKTSLEVSNFLFEEIICRYGCSDIHITDQGREFCNEVNETLMRSTGTLHRITSSYHPQANGLVERMNRTTSEILLKTMQNQDSWLSAIHTVAFAHRSSMQSSTQCTPMQFLIGRPPMLPVDVKLRGADYINEDLTQEEANQIEIEVLSQNIDELKKMRDDFIQLGKENIKKAQHRQKKYYDKRNNYACNIAIGDLVMRRLLRNVARKGGKLDKKFAGPYKCIAKTVRGSCQLEDMKGKVLKTWYPVQQLKKYMKRGQVGMSDSDSDVPNSQDSVSGSQDPVNLTGSVSGSQDPINVTGSVSGSQDPVNLTGSVSGSQDPVNLTGSVSGSQDPINVTGSVSGSQDPVNLTGSVSGSQDPVNVTGSASGSQQSANVTGSHGLKRDNDCQISGSKGAAIYKFNPISANRREEIGLSVFRFTEYNEIPQYNGLGTDLIRFPHYVYDVQPDGNCLFRAFSYMLVGMESKYDVIRQKICDFIVREENMRQFLDVDKNKKLITGAEYVILSKMRENKIWGTDVEVNAFAMMCKCNVYVYFNGDWLKFGKCPTTDPGMYLQNVHLHFEPVLSP